jgi:hypothetical protein
VGREEGEEEVNPEERALLERAVAHFGTSIQILKALEEMTELSAELWLCRKDGIERHSCIREEIADVRIMLDQLELIFGDTSEYRKQKLARLEKRMKGNE